MGQMTVDTNWQFLSMNVSETKCIQNATLYKQIKKLDQRIEQQTKYNDKKTAGTNDNEFIRIFGATLQKQHLSQQKRDTPDKHKPRTWENKSTRAQRKEKEVLP